MKISNKVLTILVVVLVIPFLIAAVSNFRGGFQIDTAAKVVKYWVDADGNLRTAAGETPVEYIDFDLGDFRRAWTRSDVSFDGSIGNFVEGATSSYPYIQSDSASSAIVWPRFHPLDRDNPAQRVSYLLPGEVYGPNSNYALTPIQTTFKLPENYRTGAKMVLTLHQTPDIRSTNVTSAPIRVGYRFFRTTPGNYWDQSAINHLPVQVTTANYLLSPVEVSLPVSASEGAFSAGEWVTFQYWKIRDAATVDILRHLAARFYYNPEY